MAKPVSAGEAAEIVGTIGSGDSRHRRGLREVAEPEVEAPDGQLAGLLRAGSDGRSAGDGRRGTAETGAPDKMVSIARTRQTEEELFQVRRELDAQLRPYRGKMTAEQLAMLEKQYLDRGVMESTALPRLSLFSMR